MRIEPTHLVSVYYGDGRDCVFKAVCMENYADNEPSFFKVKNGEIDEDVYVEHDDDDSLTLSFDDEFVFMDIKSYEIDEDNLELKYHCVDDDPPSRYRQSV